MNASQLCNFIRHHRGLWIESATGAYLHAALQDETNASVFVMGGDAKTGRPIRKLLDAGMLREEIKTCSAQSGPVGT